MASTLESTWAQYLKLSDYDVNHMKKHSCLSNPLEFLVFLDMVSRKMPKKMDASDLTVEQLQAIKNKILSGEAKHQMETFEQGFPHDSPCSLALACKLEDSFILPKQFKTNNEFKDSLPKAVNLGNDMWTESIEESRDKLWEREFPQNEPDNDISKTRFIPKYFLEKIYDIPPQFKNSFQIVKQVLSSCERISHSIASPTEASKTSKEDLKLTNSLLKTMKWAQRLVDVWQSIHKREPLWKQEDWLDTLTARLFKHGSDPDSLWFKLREHLEGASSFNIQTFLRNYEHPMLRKDGITNDDKNKCKATTNFSKKTLLEFLNSNKLLLATFFTGKLLGLKGPQCEPLVQKNGSLVGDLFEKNVFGALKDKMDDYPKWMTVFCGLSLKGDKQSMNEFDFLIILGQVKKIIYVECKFTLSDSVAKKIKKQSDNAFNYLQKHLPFKAGWEFMTWACYSKQTQVSVCSQCQPFMITDSSLGRALNELLQEKNNHSMEDETLQNEYKPLIKTYLLHALTNKQIFEGQEVAKHQLKMVDFPEQALILWNLHQLRILHKDPKRLIIQSGGLFGTGKTEILKAKAMKLASEDKNNQVGFFFARGDHLLKTYLQMQFRLYENVSFIDINELNEFDFWIESLEKIPAKQTFHVFFDEGKEENKVNIEGQLKELEDEMMISSDSFIWIVDTDNSISKSLGKDFEIEKGLVLNLRNSQDVQNAIHDIQENQDRTNFIMEQDEEKIIERIDFTLAKERDAKQILIILEDRVPFLNKLVDKIKKKEEVKIYGFTTLPDFEPMLA